MTDLELKQICKSLFGNDGKEMYENTKEVVSKMQEVIKEWNKQGKKCISGEVRNETLRRLSYGSSKHI